MNGIEFFHYPRFWGIRVDGKDLREQTAWATRELWRPELEDQFEDQEGESAELIWCQHEGLGVAEFEDRPDHFLASATAVPVLGCTCGVWECWPLTADITPTPATITWSSFRQPHRAQWGELPIGPFVFDRTAYEAALRSPTVLPEDPLGPPPPGLGV
ncbi:hypothetical protein OG562_25120 [Streptomyces sp. NBC_01275]|uniref:hypothetical protein n=1 Tax=Streptomyces sp. NBC_01275 TaxID=2903807 RepID=UPI00225369A9|nr:hypothetical protein [Streptomyces sp. NBC_01275]MCX4764180.1 hypothetical protein [Streptomyces sp. NBC_01275]